MKLDCQFLDRHLAFHPAPDFPVRQKFPRKPESAIPPAVVLEFRVLVSLNELSVASTQTPQQAEDREHLRKLLDRPSGGVIFTTLQKFSPDDGATNYPVSPTGTMSS